MATLTPHYMPAKLTQNTLYAWLHSRAGKQALQAGQKPYRVIFDPYHLHDGRPMCASADFEPNARDKRIVMAASPEEAAQWFAKSINRAIKDVQPVTV